LNVGPPFSVRMVSGTDVSPPNMYWNRPAWLSIWSTASPMKSAYMISAIGRDPVSAAPALLPTIALSLIGVSITRSPPNSS
jgi:hypothetical protein